MDRLGPLRSFVQVAQHGSFSQAAQVTGVSRAALSMAVSQLEQDLGVRLLYRTTRQMQLTPDGQLLLERARQLLADADTLNNLFRQTPEQLSGPVTIEVPHRMANQLVIPAASGLLRRLPGVQLCVRSGDGMADLIQEGVDCVIRVGALANNGLVARALGLFDLVNCVSPSYIAEHGEPHALADLAQHWIVGYAPPGKAHSASFDHVDQEGVLQSVPMRHRLLVNSTDTYTGACLAGSGLIQVPRYSVVDFLAQGALVEVLASHRAPALPVHLVYPHRKHRPARVQAVADWLAELLAPYLEAA
ncbi:LysR family transcriptional regulator [Diaphorobacter caeni]|uniref:LysR family transcriptional regulator n=1 Tax=Diaphorobacter caeni TaxID=2784387 RepID=UPI00189035C1|nr:LysR family transcriptional regulator [Diaphorobacter caeni]MBF5005311.1 LysR family transcriptional regulator [Diaphorobacter caeni]